MSSHANKITRRITRSQIIHRQLLNQAAENLSSLASCFHAGDIESTLKIGQELISLTSGLQNPHRYLVEAHHYLALLYVSTGRHDRAINNVSQMIYFAKSSGKSALFTKSLITLGVVHLSHGHIDAIRRAWEKLINDFEDLIPRAWLLHEIGRCYFECKRYFKAINYGVQCQEIARRVDSKKWYFHGKLLCGQALLKIGRFGEGLLALMEAEEVSREEGDTPILFYVRGLIQQISETLRNIEAVEGSELEVIAIQEGHQLMNSGIFVQEEDSAIDNGGLDSRDRERKESFIDCDSIASTSKTYIPNLRSDLNSAGFQSDSDDSTASNSFLRVEDSDGVLTSK